MISNYNLADHILAIEVSEKLDKDLMDQIEDMVEERLQRHEKINIFLELGRGITLPALLKDLNFHRKHQGKFDKIALVTEKESVQKLMDFKDFFLNADIQTFENENRITALNWVME